MHMHHTLAFTMVFERQFSKKTHGWEHSSDGTFLTHPLNQAAEDLPPRLSTVKMTA